MTPLKVQSFMLPKILGGLLVAILIAGSLYYVLFQARFLIGGPQVNLIDPPATVQTERQITLTGTTANITAIYLNGRPMVTDEYGAFTESIILQNGYNRIRIDATDRYGRKTYVEQPFVYRPIATSSATTTLSN